MIQIGKHRDSNNLNEASSHRAASERRIETCDENLAAILAEKYRKGRTIDWDPATSRHGMKKMLQTLKPMHAHESSGNRLRFERNTSHHQNLKNVTRATRMSEKFCCVERSSIGTRSYLMSGRLLA